MRALGRGGRGCRAGTGRSQPWNATVRVVLKTCEDVEDARAFGMSTTTRYQESQGLDDGLGGHLYVEDVEVLGPRNWLRTSSSDEPCADYGARTPGSLHPCTLQVEESWLPGHRRCHSSHHSTTGAALVNVLYSNSMSRGPFGSRSHEEGVRNSLGTGIPAHIYSSL